MMKRYLDPHLRKQDQHQKKVVEENAFYKGLLDERHIANAVSLQKRERKILKAEKRELQKMADERKGLRKVVQDKGADDSSTYITSDSGQSNSDRENKQDEKLQEIFDMNEIQIHAMLAKAIANKGDKIDDELEAQLNMKKMPIQMTEKQRLKCLLIVQIFFAGLGDDSAINLKDQANICKRIKEKNEQKKKELINAEIKRKKDAKRSVPLSEQGTEDEREEANSAENRQKKGTEGSHTEITESGEENFDEEGEINTARLARQAKREEKAKKKEEEKINVNTNTVVQVDSKAKRDKLDEAVRKILLFKDMKQTETKGDQDPSIKLNQVFIKDTIAQYSGSITAPTHIVRKKLSLTSYFLNDGVCKSLCTYFQSLTFNALQLLELKDNGLKDINMYTILSGLSDQRALKQLSYSENEMGPKTAEEISKILLWPNPTNLERLQLNNLKTTNYSLAIVLAALKGNRKLLQLDIEQIPLNNQKHFEYLSLFMKSNQSLKKLRLSWVSFMPSQTVDMMKLIQRRKGIRFLDLSYNNMMPSSKHKNLVKAFVDSMRRFILRSQIFHLDLTGMNLGKLVTKLVHSIKANSTLNCIHLSKNNVPLEIMYNMDQELAIPETLGDKLTRFRPLIVDQQKIEETKSTDRKKEEPHQPVPAQTLKQELIEEFKRLQAEKGHQAEKKEIKSVDKQVAVASLVQPLNQNPLIYQRMTNHPEFVYPLNFRRKPGQSQAEAFKMMQQMISQRIQMIAARKASAFTSEETKDQKNSNKLDPRQDSVYYTQDFCNKWSKIEQLTNLQIKKGKKGLQPDFSGVTGREGIVNTNHETCWVCEKRKYILMAVNMEPDTQKKTWGQPIRSTKECEKLRKKYLPNGQMPGQLNDQPILVSSINDWFPVHLINVVPFSMLFDYNLVKEASKEFARDRDTKDSVAKFKEGYKQIIDHAQGIKKMEPVLLRIYGDIWRQQILKNLIYPQDTLFIDFPNPEEQVDPDYLFLFAGFVKPGKHRSLLYDPVADVWYKRDFYVDEREDEDLPKFANYENTLAEKGAVRNSILKDWKRDTEQTLRNCMTHDEKYWKIGNSQFIKEPKDYQILRELILTNMSMLKDIFLHAAAKDQFPLITSFGTEELAKDMGLYDGKYVHKDTVNRMFIAANVSDNEEVAQNPSSALIRYEFIEFLVRIGKAKYKESGEVKTVASSFQKMLSQILEPYWKEHCQDWQPFRDKFIHKTVIDHLMHANKRSLEQIFVHAVQQSKGQKFDISGAFIIERQLKLGLLDSQIVYCFGLSQQTVVDETKKSGQYDKIVFLEFVEFLCRILYTKFKAVKEVLAHALHIDVEKKPDPVLVAANGSSAQKVKSPSQHATNIQTSQVNSQKTTSRATLKEKNEALKKAEHEKHLLAFKEFCCQKLDLFFNAANLGLTFIDPDAEAIEQSESAESAFQYDLPSGYDSKDENNPDLISLISSGNSSDSSEEDDALLNHGNTESISQLSLDAMAEMSVITKKQDIQKRKAK